MNAPRKSILHTLLKSLILPSILAMGLSILLMLNLVKEEYDELQDSGLTSIAHLLLTVFDASSQTDGTVPAT